MQTPVFILTTIFLLASGCYAIPQDLGGKAFTFGGTTNSYVRLHPTLNGNINVASVCLRYFSDIPDNGREQTFFSLATPAYSNGFVLYKSGQTRYQIIIGSSGAVFWGLPDELTRWNSFCVTWESTTGLAQLWVNGKPSSRKFVFKGGSLTGTPIVVLGHDQDAYGGAFNQNDALIGQLRDVHMWDRVISACEINSFTENTKFQGGNLINWQALEYTRYGNVIEEHQINENVKQDCDLVEKCMQNEACRWL